MLESQQNEIIKILKNMDEKLNTLIQKQKQDELKMEELNEKLNNIYEDIYETYEDGFEISCPYCNFIFNADIDENFNEIKCPECGNSIELDWTGNLDDGEDFGCNGGCSHCKGC